MNFRVLLFDDDAFCLNQPKRIDVIDPKKMSMMFFRKCLRPDLIRAWCPSSDRIRGHAFRHHALAALLAMAGAAPAAAATVFVSNERDHTVSVLDSDKLQVVQTFKVGRRPRGILVTPDGRYVLVCASDDNRVEVYDAKTFKLVRTLRSGPDPELFVLHPSGNPLYIANEDDNMVTVVDIETNRLIAEVPVGVEPEGMGISPDGKTIVNTSETTNMVHFIDGATHEVVDNVLVDARPRFAEYQADGTKLWVTSEIGGTVAVIDPATRKVIKTIDFTIPGVNKDAIQPVGVRVTKNGRRAFVALGPANRVAVINGETYEVERYLLVGQRVWQLAFSPDEKLLFTTNGASNDISVVDTERLRVTKSITVGRFPWGVAVAPQ
jgi:PQQ-dependent catabolism-associated beta-propeller protein